METENRGYLSHLCKSCGFAFQSCLASMSFVMNGLFTETLFGSGSKRIERLYYSLKHKDDEMV
jgi:hypothetical protein